MSVLRTHLRGTGWRPKTGCWPAFGSVLVWGWRWRGSGFPSSVRTLTVQGETGSAWSLLPLPCSCLTCKTKLPSSHPTASFVCLYTHTHTHRHTQHTGRKCYSRKPNPLDHPVCFRQNPLHAGWWCHKFHSSKILHIKGEQWWKIHEISKQGQAPAGLSLPRWVTQARGLWHRVLELQGLVVLGFSENALSLVRCFHAAWEPVLVCLGGQRSSRNSHPPPEHQGRAHSRAEAKTHPEVSQDSNKEGSGRGKFLTFRHSQLAKVEWKNHYWMYFLCHSEERF